MGYIYEQMSDLKAGDIAAIVRSEARKLHGEFIFRGKNFSDWYDLAMDAFESWVGGDEWGRCFEKVAEELELMELSLDLEDMEYE